MNKKELSKKVAEVTGLGKGESEKAVEATFDIIADALRAHEKVQLVGFGTFDTKHVEASDKRNPQTGAEVHVAEHYKPTFKYAGTFSDEIKGKTK